VSIPFREFVPGDIVCLDAGRGVPGDCLILTSKDLFANEAALTGETYPVEKSAGVVAADAPLAKRQNVLFMGAHVVSGTALAVVAATGGDTEFGKVSSRLRAAPRETDFERGIRRFGFLLMEITLVMMTGIFALNVLFDKPAADSFMFSLALAVGLTPQLLPAIVSVNLAAGARRLAASKVIVRRLAAIENFGSMNVLCSDKTGTLTDGVVHIKGAYAPSGEEDPGVFELAYVNGAFQSGFANPIDQAIKEQGGVDMAAWEKLDEIPYDFVRKRLGILTRHQGTSRLVVKGALLKILEVCDRAAMPGGGLVPLAAVRDDILARYESFGHEGLRCMGLAFRDMGQTRTATKADESGMVFAGFLTLWDPPKPGIAATVANLAAKGVRLKVITGDNRHVAASLGRQMGLADPVVLTGPDMRVMSPPALVARAATVDVFAEVEPNQKEDIVLALQKAGFVVGFMGDGINDASAIKAADVGLSVEGAVDVAKEAADIVLLDPDLGVLENGVLLGRQTFANTLKYIFMATSANFGNMFSMAGASLFLPFLPLLPTQVLLTNLLTDLPEMTIASDAVDPDMVDRPRRWDIRFIRNFMLVFGPLSSVFDCLTFVVLLHFLHASEALFQTGWFVESVVSAALIVLVVRTKRTILTSRPSRLLLWSTLAVAGVTVWLPFGPLAELFGFVPLPWAFLPALVGIVALYVVSAELAKKWFYRRFG
jgi:Mg2+-importing ATPase